MKEKYTDKSGDKKYFAMIPYYIVNHSTSYEQSLYLVMKRIASEDGTCWASPTTIGKMMCVSANTVRKYREKLIKRGWIAKIGQKGITKPTDEFEIVDLWALNMKFYSKKESSTGEQSKKESSTGEKKVQLVNIESSTGGNKEETLEEKLEEDILHSGEAATNDLIFLFKEVNPSYEQLFKNKTQRACLDRLVKKWGAERVGAWIKALPKIINRKYAPRVTTPYGLESKLGELAAFTEQESRKSVVAPVFQKNETA